MVFDLEGVGDIDTTGVEVFGQVVDDLARQHTGVVGVARARPGALDRLGPAGLLQPEGPVRAFLTINQAVRAFQER